MASAGNGWLWSAVASTDSSSTSVVTRMSRSRSAAPPRNPFVYQELCLRKARMAPTSPSQAASRRAWSSITEVTPAKSGGFDGSRLAKTSARSRKSHGRPRHPRPTITPSQPVVRIMRSASSASQMSPLPSTGMLPTCSTSAAITSQRASPA